MLSAGKKRIALVAVTCIATLAAAEVVLRLFVPAASHFHFPTGRFPDVQFERRADWSAELDGVAYHFDHDGFRVGSGHMDGDAILFVGDSFTVGQRVDDASTLPLMVEAALRKDGVKVRSLNAGVAGFGAAQERRLLPRLLKRFPVKALVIEAFPNDDLADNWIDGGFGIEGGKLVAFDPPHVPPLIKARELMGDSPIAKLALVRGLANAFVGPYTFTPANSDELYSVERELLAAMVAEAQAHKVPVVVMSVPARWELLGDKTIPEHRADLERYERVVRDMKSLGVPSLDLRTVLNLTDSYIENDGHLSAHGNERTAEALAGMLRPMLGSQTATALPH